MPSNEPCEIWLWSDEIDAIRALPTDATPGQRRGAAATLAALARRWNDGGPTSAAAVRLATRPTPPTHAAIQDLTNQVEAMIQRSPGAA